MALNAGDIVFNLTADDSKFRATMATTSRAVGAAMTAAGAAITGFAAVSITSFATTADELAKMSQRTGFSVTALSELKFAAEQSGTSIEGIEKASRNLSSVIVDAAGGNETYQASLAALGLSWETLATQTPEEQFLNVGMALADVENATLRTSLAGDLFGARMGTQLLPMLNAGSAGLQAMRDEAVRLGLSIGPEQAAQAELFNDTMDQMKASLGGLGREVAVIMIPTLTELMAWVRDTAVSFGQWRDQNPELVAALTKFTIAAGAIMTVLGPILVILPGIAAAFTAVKATVIGVMAVFGVLGGAVSAPVAIAIAAVGALAAAGVYLWNNWEMVKGKLIGVWEVLKNAFELLFAPILAAWGMIKNAVGYTDTSGLNQAAVDRYNGVQASTGFQAATQLGGGPAGGGGGNGGVTIQNLNVMSNDPRAASRDIAENLYNAMLGAGVSFA